MAVMRRTLAGLLLLAGCHSDESIAPLSDFSVVAYVDDGARITLEHEEDDGLDSRHCLILEDGVTAAIAGVPFTLTTAGGWVENEYGGKDCEFPRLVAADLPEVADATLTIGPLECAVGDALVPFAIELDPPGPWTFAPGQSFTVRAQKPADTFVLTAQVRESGASFPTELGQVSAGDTLRVTIPAHFAGDYELVVLARHDTSLAATFVCQGFLLTSHRARQTITVAP